MYILIKIKNMKLFHKMTPFVSKTKLDLFLVVKIRTYFWLLELKITVVKITAAEPLQTDGFCRM